MPGGEESHLLYSHIYIFCGGVSGRFLCLMEYQSLLVI